MKGTMKFYYTNQKGESFNVQFTNAELDTPSQDIINAATVMGSSLMADSIDDATPLTFIQATGMIESVLATSPD